MGRPLLASLVLLAGCGAHTTQSHTKIAKQSAQARQIAPDAQSRVIGVAPDGSFALLSLGGFPGFQHGGWYRRVALPSGSVMDEWRARALPGLPVDGMIDAAQRRAWHPTAGLEQELAHLRDLWMGVRDARHSRFAGGTRGTAFGVGDALFVSDALGRNIGELSSSAAYQPRISPDGSTVAFAQHMGRISGHGNYVLNTAPLPAGRPVTRIADAEDVLYESLTYNTDGTRLYFVGADRARGQFCLRTARASGGAATSLQCGARSHSDVQVSYSPSKNLAVLALWTREPSQGAGTVEVQWIRLPEGTVTHRFRRSGVFVLGGVTDTGFTTASVAMETLLIDPQRRVNVTTSVVRALNRFEAVAWRRDGEVVVSSAAGVRVIDLRAIATASGGEAWPWR